jgi:hypothetical protein
MLSDNTVDAASMRIMAMSSSQYGVLIEGLSSVLSTRATTFSAQHTLGLEWQKLQATC